MQDRMTHPEEGPVAPPPEGTLKERQVLSRRILLGSLGVAAAGGALTVVSYRDDAQAATTKRGVAVSKGAAATQAANTVEHAWCMVIDLRTCDGCKACTTSCQQRHQLREEQTWINVYDMQDAARWDIPHAAALHDVRGPSVHVHLPGRSECAH